MARFVDQDPVAFRRMCADNWYVYFRAQRVGPLSLSELTARYGAGELQPADMVWHGAIGDWVALREIMPLLAPPQQQETAAIDPIIVRRLRQTGQVVARNGLYMGAAAVAAVIFLLAANALVSHNQGGPLGPLFALLAIGLGWWAWLEYRGVRFSGTRLIYPSRAPFWPSLIPYRIRDLDLAEVESAAYHSAGDFVHVIVLKSEERAIRLVFESAPMRDLVLAILSLHMVRIGKA